MKFIEVKFSPEAKHAWKWFHTWLGIVAGGASLAYAHLDSLQGTVSPQVMSYVNLLLVLLMVYNTMRAKKK